MAFIWVIFIYVSNESSLDVNVYFPARRCASLSPAGGDDFQITHTSAANVLQADDYYPFGLAMENNNFTEEGVTANRFLYQGKEWQAQLALNLFDFGSRHYDPALGRWHNLDPQAQFASPYLAMGNMPTMGIDPDGELAWFVIPVIVGVVTGAINVATNWSAITAAGGGWSSVGTALGSFGIGFAAGALGTLGAAAAAPAITAALGTGFVGGAALGAIGGTIGGLIQGSGNTWMNGGTFAQGITSGLIGAGTGALIGGATGGIFSGAYSVFKGGNFWKGNIPRPAATGPTKEIKLPEPPKSDTKLPLKEIKNIPDSKASNTINNSLDNNNIKLGGDFLDDAIDDISQPNIFKGDGHGVPQHWNEMNKVLDDLVKSGEYTDIYLDRSLNTALGKQIPNVGGWRPDVIGIGPNNTIYLSEVVSPSQTFVQIQNKMTTMVHALLDAGYNVKANVISPVY